MKGEIEGQERPETLIYFDHLLKDVLMSCKWTFKQALKSYLAHLTIVDKPLVKKPSTWKKRWK